MIVLDGVSKKYNNGVRAIRNMNITVADGEFVFIMGKSGSGKSTLMRLLMKEIEPDEGRITVNEFELRKMPRRYIPKYRRNIGMVFQDFRLLKDLNVYDNVAFAQRAIGRSEREIRENVPKALQMVGLSSKYKNYPHELSGGERQRVAIARAIINKPSIILADEPTGNLDEAMAEEIMKLLEEINRTGTTVIVITHSHEIAESRRHRIITLDKGLVVNDTVPEKVVLGDLPEILKKGTEDSSV